MAEQRKRGVLRQVAPRGPVLRFQWNPETVQQGGGVGGWNRIGRPKRLESLEWAGQPARTLTFTLTFDAFEKGGTVEPECRRLVEMGEPRGDEKPPPVLEFDYGPIGSGKRQWVIDDLQWGPELRNAALERVRAEVTVMLVQHVVTDVTLTPAERHSGKAKQGGGDGGGKGDQNPKGKRRYTVKKGDTLSRIAARELGKASRWPEIAKLNGLRDPNHLKVGQKLLLPGV